MNFLKGFETISYHIFVIVLSAAIALSLPCTITFIAQKCLIYWSHIENEKIFRILMTYLSFEHVFRIQHIEDTEKALWIIDKNIKEAFYYLISPSGSFVFLSENVKRLQILNLLPNFSFKFLLKQFVERNP